MDAREAAALLKVRMLVRLQHMSRPQDSVPPPWMHPRNPPGEPPCSLSPGHLSLPFFAGIFFYSLHCWLPTCTESLGHKRNMLPPPGSSPIHKPGTPRGSAQLSPPFVFLSPGGCEEPVWEQGTGFPRELVPAAWVQRQQRGCREGGTNPFLSAHLRPRDSASVGETFCSCRATKVLGV